LRGHTAKLLTEPDEVKTVEVRRKNGRVVRKTITVTSEKKKRWEFEADETGLELLRIAGYPEMAMQRVLEYLTAEEERENAKEPQSPVDELRSTHPRSSARLAALREILARETPRDPGPPAVTAAAAPTASPP